MIVTVIVLFLIVSAAATLVDRNEANSAWAQELYSAVASYGRTDPNQTRVARVHRLFCDLFDFVYGERILSAHRLGASIISTFVSLGIVVTAIGLSDTIFAALSMLGEARELAESIESVAAEEADEDTFRALLQDAVRLSAIGNSVRRSSGRALSPHSI